MAMLQRTVSRNCFCVVDYLPVDVQWNNDFALLNLNVGYPYNRF